MRYIFSTCVANTIFEVLELGKIIQKENVDKYKNDKDKNIPIGQAEMNDLTKMFKKKCSV